MRSTCPANYSRRTTMTLQQCAFIATIVSGFGLPLAAFVFIWGQWKEARNREFETYKSVAKEYRDFLRLCVQYSHLQVYDFDPDHSVVLTPDQQRQKMILWDLLVSTMETAYFLYEGQSTDFKRRQWIGWRVYMLEWCRRPDFKVAWMSYLGHQYDEKFLSLMAELFREADAPLAPQQPVPADGAP